MLGRNVALCVWWWQQKRPGNYQPAAVAAVAEFHDESDSWNSSIVGPLGCPLYVCESGSAARWNQPKLQQIMTECGLQRWGTWSNRDVCRMVAIIN